MKSDVYIYIPLKTLNLIQNLSSSCAIWVERKFFNFSCHLSKCPPYIYTLRENIYLKRRQNSQLCSTATRKHISRPNIVILLVYIILSHVCIFGRSNDFCRPALVMGPMGISGTLLHIYQTT